MYKYLIAPLLFLSVSITSGQQPTRIFADDRTPGQGRIWLGWKPQSRERFIAGYLAGLVKGHLNGCSDYQSVAQPEQPAPLDKVPIVRCDALTPRFSRSFGDYTNTITTFYRKYPEDIDLPILKILEQLSDARHKSLEEIHMWYHDPPHE